MKHINQCYVLPIGLVARCVCTHAVAVMSGSARMQFLPTLSLGVTWARELWRADSRAAVSGGCAWGGGEVRARERVVRGDRVSNLRLAYLKSTWVCAGNLKRCSLHQLQNKVRLSLIYVQHRCYPLCLLHTGTPLWEEWLLPTVLQSSSQCSLGHRGEGLQWSPPLGWAGGGGGEGRRST